MTRLESAAIICLLGISFSLCTAVSGAQGTGRRTGSQSSTIFTVGPTSHLRKGLDVWPKIIAPQNPAADRANAIISAMNRSAAKALRDCDDSYRQNFGLPGSARIKDDWDRRITVTMRGPRFIAMTATETSICDRSYPLNDHVSVVFDMATGELARWTDFMIGVNETAATTFKSIDGATSSGISTSGLTELALKRADTDPECRQALESLGQIEFQVWPDARHRQLIVKAIGLPHVVQACEEDIGLSIPEAREQGFRDDVLAAIEKAHQLLHSPVKK